MTALRCLLRGHVWEAHPAFDGMPVRWCTRCRRVETHALTGRWRHIAHLDGLSETDVRVRGFHRKLARELNEQLMRRGDPRAIR